MIGKAIAMLAIVVAAAAANGSPPPIPGLPQSAPTHLAPPPAPMEQGVRIEQGVTGGPTVISTSRPHCRRGRVVYVPTLTAENLTLMCALRLTEPEWK